MSSLYLHIPFCTSKCPYCDFFSGVGTQQQLDDYVDLLLLNIDILKRRQPRHNALSTLYFGGGTPSLLSAAQIDRILNRVDRTFGIQTDAELTLEANPGTLQQQQLCDYRTAGLNRLSIGIQSLCDRNLSLLGRRHTSQQARSSIVMARQAGFHNLSLDLIFALPDQTLAELAAELTELLSLEPEHISIYGLTYEEGTEFQRLKNRGELHECAEELYTDLYHLIHDQLTGAHYEHYEISNFARPGKRCNHNSAYWLRQNCLAAGAGAHGFTSARWGERWHIPTSIEDYKQAVLRGDNPSLSLETFTKLQAMQEYFYLGLRTSDGVSRAAFEQQFHCCPEDFFSKAFRQTSAYLVSDSHSWRFKLEGWLIFDHLITAFL